jgi:uncharacterized protein YjbI with pentapeptide repeats
VRGVRLLALIGSMVQPRGAVAVAVLGRLPVAALVLAGAALAAHVSVAGPASERRTAQVASPDGPGQPAAVEALRFRYDATSGRCLDAEGREGYNPGSRKLVETGMAECADLSGRGINMTYLRLVGANLRGANFANVLWYLGSITGSDLTGANLAGTFGQMDYQGSRLRGARLTGADLTWSDLGDADLHGADLRGALFSPHTRLPFSGEEARRRGMVFKPAP